MRTKTRAVTPVYWRRNAVKNAERKILLKKNDCARTEANRAAVGQVASYCAIIAAYDVLGIDRDGVDRLAAEMSRRADVYMIERQHRGVAYARKQLEQRTAAFLPDGFVLPAGWMPKSRNERRMLAERRDAGGMVIRFYVEALNARGFAAGDITAAVEETRRNYGQFLEWAKDGEDVAYEKLRRVTQQTIGGKVCVVDSGETEPVFEPA